jgi:hypothetical protein
MAEGTGRVYLILATGTDKNDLVGFDCATVVVPLNQTQAAIASVGQAAATASAYCKASGTAPSGYVQVGIGPVVGPKQ